MAVLKIIAHEKKFMLGRGQDYLENLDGKKLDKFIAYINQTHDSMIPDIMYKS
ncbi:MAG: hypothetical protein JNM93_12030 [Bacteriovoracaceae bacterium]|nr:hypothetical protein [Bacteriovoracaceae bacterium]